MSNKNVYYCYGTEEYKEKERLLKIDTEQASLIFAEEFFKKNPEKNDVHINLDIIYNDYYVFSEKLILYNTKTGKYFVKNTYWVNGNTKDIKESTEDELDIILKIPKQFFSKILTRKQ